MIHERFDIDHWKALFPLNELRAQAKKFVLARKEQLPAEYPTQEAVNRHIRLMEPGGSHVTGPQEIAVLEQIREEVFNRKPDAPQERIPTDIFVFGVGEPPRRETTKIGGLPYWPRSRPWPHTRHGVPMQFAAQVCFADSHDIVGNLPGDILLVFFDYDEYFSELDPSVLRLEWATLGETDLVSANDVPHSEYKFLPYYGQMHRTYDYPFAKEIFEDYGRSYQLNVLEGTKIGGVPRWVQDDPGLPGRFICAVGSISPQWYTLYPFINASQPIDESYEQPEGYYDLMWADVGSLYIFMGDNSELYWDVQFY